MELKSKYFKDLADLINEKNKLVSDDRNRAERERMIRNFYNGQPTMTEEEAKEEGREEITNHLLGHKAIEKLEGRIFNIYASPGPFIDIKIDTNSPELDSVWSVEMSKDVCKAIRKSNEFAFIWRSVSGELNLTGRAPLIFDSPLGWCPEFCPKMLIPRGTAPVARRIPYAFVPREMTLANLEDLKAKAGLGGGHINGPAIEELIEKLKEQVTNGSKTTAPSDPAGGFAAGVSVTQQEVFNSSRKTTVDVWWFYELNHKEDGEITVSATLFSEAIAGTAASGSQPAKPGVDARLLGSIPDMIDAPESWAHLMVLDSEIGGVKTFDASKGKAELSYASDLDTEEMLNVMIEGDKARAMPRFQEEADANRDEILAWNPNDDSIVPKGIKEFNLRGNGQHLMTPIGLLRNNAAGFSDDQASNIGGMSQLRVQALRSQQLAAEAETLRMADIYMSADGVMEEIVNRFCTADISNKRCPGYNDIAWFRQQMKMKGIPYKELAEKSYGRFMHMEVKCRRLSGGGLMDQQQASAEFLMKNIGAYPPESRPMIMKRATLYFTGDADLAEELVKIPPMVINGQKLTAENERDTIFARAATGQPLPVNADDIDQDHVPVHLVDLEAKLLENELQPWDMLDAAQFLNLHRHTAMHIQRMLSVDHSMKEAQDYIAPLQQLATQGDAIISKLQEQQAAQQQAAGGGEPMTQKEQADVQLKAGQLQLDQQKLQLKAADQQGVQQQRDARTQLAARSQALKEGMAAHKVQSDRIKALGQALKGGA